MATTPESSHMGAQAEGVRTTQSKPEEHNLLLNTLMELGLMAFVRHVGARRTQPGAGS